MYEGHTVQPLSGSRWAIWLPHPRCFFLCEPRRQKYSDTARRVDWFALALSGPPYVLVEGLLPLCRTPPPRDRERRVSLGITFGFRGGLRSTLVIRRYRTSISTEFFFEKPQPPCSMIGSQAPSGSAVTRSCCRAIPPYDLTDRTRPRDLISEDRTGSYAKTATVPLLPREAAAGRNHRDCKPVTDASSSRLATGAKKTAAGGMA